MLVVFYLLFDAWCSWLLRVVGCLRFVACCELCRFGRCCTLLVVDGWFCVVCCVLFVVCVFFVVACCSLFVVCGL